jgi:hypothetical protein
MPTYELTCSEILRITKLLAVTETEYEDGRTASAIKEGPFLEELKRQLLESNPTWEVIIAPPRAPCDIIINSIRINLKLSDCKTGDNSGSKPSIFYSITGSTNYPKTSTWNDFLQQMKDEHASIKTVRNKLTEYHYLVKNKVTGDALLKPIFDIHTYISNPSNDLQIHWGNEFMHILETTPDSEYLKKVESLLTTIQRSVREMIARTSDFAAEDMATLLTPV